MIDNEELQIQVFKAVVIAIVGFLVIKIILIK